LRPRETTLVPARAKSLSTQTPSRMRTSTKAQREGRVEVGIFAVHRRGPS
jgi:hypothetical protein